MQSRNPGLEPSYNNDPVAKLKAVKKLTIYDQLVTFQNLTNLDIHEVRSTLAKIGVPIEGHSDDQVMAICHYCRFRLNFVSDADKRASENWLRFHQFPV